MADDIFYLIIVGIAMILFLLSGIILISKGIRSKFKALQYLGISYIIMIFVFLLMVSTIPFYFVYLLQYVVFSLVVLFVHYAYFNQVKSPVKIVFIIQSLLFVILFVQSYLHEIDILPSSVFLSIFDNTLSIIVSMVVFGWMGYATQSKYIEMKDKNVQPWLKKKTIIVFISAYIETMVSLPDLLKIFLNNNEFFAYVQAIIIISFGICQFLAWAMPKPFKKFLNKGYVDESASLEDMNEDELMKGLMAED